MILNIDRLKVDIDIFKSGYLSLEPWKRGIRSVPTLERISIFDVKIDVRSSVGTLRISPFPWFNKFSNIFNKNVDVFF